MNRLIQGRTADEEFQLKVRRAFLYLLQQRNIVGGTARLNWTTFAEQMGCTIPTVQRYSGYVPTPPSGEPPLSRRKVDNKQGRMSDEEIQRIKEDILDGLSAQRDTSGALVLDLPSIALKYGRRYPTVRKIYLSMSDEEKRGE